MTDKKRDAGSLKLLGGRLCLDFVNTLDWRGTDTPQEFLNTFDDLVIWCRHVGITNKEETRLLYRLAEQSVSNARKVLNRAISLREAIYRLFSASIAGRDPVEEDLNFFNENLSLSMKDSKITRTDDGYRWDNIGNKTQLDWILNPIIRSAFDILVSDELKKVKACADQACGWLFIDVSRNQSRRWCDMKDCGNRAKASRFYKRKQSDDLRKGAKKPR
ncbi:MAG: CGNR zinc finger domain-containing protein [Desulfobacterales bacterium]|nr:MAG: CGNR zinc finger domain-containing protein [Desulfobacterales bacterium]